MIAAVIPAAGQGQRMGNLPVPSKQLMSLDGVPALIRTIRVFNELPEIEAIVLVAPENLCEQFRALVQDYRCEKVRWIVPGGKERQESVYLGLQALPPDCEVAVIHDGGRPLVSAEVVRACLEQARQSEAASAAVPVKDTIKVSRDGKVVDQTLDRSTLWQIQTPQAFSYSVIRGLHEQAQKDGIDVTDDAALAEAYGYTVSLTPGSYENIKLTTAEDLVLAEAILRRRQPYAATRSGIGYDVHQLVEGRALVLGGVNVPHSHGLLGHSDADVALHALMDSILGAAGLGDIGRHFPDTDETYRGASSLRLLQQVITLVGTKGFRVGNVDVTIVAQRPKLAPYIGQMQTNIAAACQVSSQNINVKATTTEGLGFAGRGEGIAAYATCLLVQSH